MRRSFKNYHFKFIRTALLFGLVLAGAFFIILLEDKHEESIEANGPKIREYRPDENEDSQLLTPAGVHQEDSLFRTSSHREFTPDNPVVGGLGLTERHLTVGNCFPKQGIYLFYGKDLKPIRLKNFHQNYLVDSSFLKIPVGSDLYLFIPQKEEDSFFYAVKRADFIDMQVFEEVFPEEQFHIQNFKESHLERNFSAGFRDN